MPLPSLPATHQARPPLQLGDFTVAAPRLPPEYAGRVVSSVTSCHGLSVAIWLRKLRIWVTKKRNTKNMGVKEIAYKQKKMSQIADKIQTKLDSPEELEPGFLAVIESALDQSDDLA